MGVSTRDVLINCEGRKLGAWVLDIFDGVESPCYTVCF